MQLLTKDAALQVEQGPRVAHVHRREEDVDGERMGDRRASMEDDEERALATEIGDEELEEGVDDEGLTTSSVATFRPSMNLDSPRRGLGRHR
jgi:hypothetical protein